MRKLILISLLFTFTECTLKVPDLTPYTIALISLIRPYANSNNVPSALTYTGNPYTYTVNIPIVANTPIVTGKITSCIANPALPAGLNLANTTCSISGTPNKIQTVTNYTIMASNNYGSTTATITITVNDKAPSGLNYAGNPFNFTNGVTITAVNPTITGTPISYSVSPSLPTGLNINTTTGQLAGTPTAITSTTTYTVTATNSGGSTTFALTITIAWTATARTLPSSAVWQSVTYGNGTFVAVASGPSNIAAASPDGITWTARTLPSSASWISVTYGNGTFVVVAGGPSNIAATSP